MILTLTSYETYLEESYEVSIEVVPMLFWIFFVSSLLLNWLLFLLRIGFFCVALNSGGHPYPMGSFYRVIYLIGLGLGC